MRLGVRIALALALVAGLAIAVATLAQDPSNAAAAPARWESSEQCRACHAEVFAEWEGSQHQIAYLNPEVRALSDDFRNKECQACHLPRPVFETGLGNRPLQRTARPNEGIDCLTCHLSKEGQIFGRSSQPQAGCKPQASAELISVAVCEVCHNQHWTTDQWRASDFFKRGVECNDCHMPKVARSSGAQGRSHVFPAAHDVEMLKSAGRFAARREGDELVLSYANTGAGHSFPTEERSRAADMVYRFFGPDGPLDEFVRAWRFRMPYRDEPGEDTQLPAGATKEVRVPIPSGATRAVARLWYRLAPYIDDAHPRSTLLFEHEVDLR